MTVDGSFPLGAAVTATMITHGVNPNLTKPVSFLAGAAAGFCTGIIHVGFCTGIIHVKGKVRDLLSGIIMMTALWTINLRIAGKANVPIFGEENIFDNETMNGIFSGGAAKYKVKVRDLLSGIIMMTALWTINLRIAGKANVPIFGEENIFDNETMNGIFSGGAAKYKVLVVVFILAVIVKIILDLYLQTKSGFLLRAVGDNANLVTRQNPDFF